MDVLSDVFWGYPLARTFNGFIVIAKHNSY